MALIECPECGGKVSNSAVSCPIAGFLSKRDLEMRDHFAPIAVARMNLPRFIVDIVGRP